jgi:hypothetical protein
MTLVGSLEDRYCAFIDILGFTEYVRSLSRARTESDRNQIIERLTRVSARFAEEKQDFLDYFGKGKRKGAGALTYFSDLIFISIQTEVPHALRRLFHYTQRISTAFLIDGFLTRGAIVRGYVHHVDAVVFGPALLDAHQLESTFARFPRIMIARSALPNLEEADKVTTGMLIPCDDGPTALNCLKFFESFADRIVRPDSEHFVATEKYRQRLGFVRDAREHLQNQIRETRDNPRYYEKVRWLADEFNRRVINRVQSGVAGWPLPVSLQEIWPSQPLQ